MLHRPSLGALLKVGSGKGQQFQKHLVHLHKYTWFQVIFKDKNQVQSSVVKVWNVVNFIVIQHKLLTMLEVKWSNCGQEEGVKLLKDYLFFIEVLSDWFDRLLNQLVCCVNTWLDDVEEQDIFQELGIVLISFLRLLEAESKDRFDNFFGALVLEFWPSAQL